MFSRAATAMSFFTASSITPPHTTRTWARRSRSRPMSIPLLCSSGMASLRKRGRYRIGQSGEKPASYKARQYSAARCSFFVCSPLHAAVMYARGRFMADTSFSVVGINLSPRPSHSWEGGGSGESSPSLGDRWHIRGGRSRAKPPVAVAKPLLTARARICEKATGDGESFKSRITGETATSGQHGPKSVTSPARPSSPAWRCPSACPSTRPEVSESDPSFHGASCPCRNTG